MVNGAPNPEGAGVLMAMIGKAKMEAYREQLAETRTEEQVERYFTIMGKIVPQRRNYAGVNVGAGEGDALDVMPAQTIVETYKSQLEEQVKTYNEGLTK